MLPTDDVACVKDFQQVLETTRFQRNLASFMKNNKKSFINEFDQDQATASVKEQQLNMLLIEMLKFRSSEKSKGVLEEQFGNDHLKDLMLNGQICQKSHLNPLPPPLDQSITEPLHQKLVDKKLVNLTRYKTELCRQFEEKGHCQYGEKCQFAHGIVEKRFVERHPKYKTEMCRTFHQQGFCSYGLRCNFIHNEDERRFGSVSESSTSSVMQDRVVSPSSVLVSKMLVANSHSGDLSGYSVIREPTRSMSVVESSLEKNAFPNYVNTLLHLKGLAELSTEGIPSFHPCVGSGVSAIAKDQKSRGRPILSRSVSSAVPSLFSEDDAV